MATAALPKGAFALFAAATIACLTCCSFQVQPVNGFMMRIHCPLAMLAMHLRPAPRPLPAMRSDPGASVEHK
jgi:hypothetical protein